MADCCTFGEEKYKLATMIKYAHRLENINEMKLGSDEYLIEAQVTLDKVLAILWKTNNNLTNPDDDLMMAMWTMAWPIVESGMSLLELSQKQRMRDCYIIARPIFEHVLNIGYFGAKGQDTIIKALQHTHQKSYRDLNREINIKDIRVAIGLKNLDNIQVTDELRHSIDEFTNQKGFEVRSWTGDNTFKKIEIISEKYGKDIGTILTMNLFYIYRHSSEIIHGTVFGTMFSRGMTKLSHEWPENDEQLRKHQNIYISFILQNTILMTYCAAKIIDTHYPMKKDFEQIKKIVITYREKFEKK